MYFRLHSKQHSNGQKAYLDSTHPLEGFPLVWFFICGFGRDLMIPICTDTVRWYKTRSPPKHVMGPHRSVLVCYWCRLHEVPVISPRQLLLADVVQSGPCDITSGHHLNHSPVGYPITLYSCATATLSAGTTTPWF